MCLWIANDSLQSLKSCLLMRASLEQDSRIFMSLQDPRQRRSALSCASRCALTSTSPHVLTSIFRRVDYLLTSFPLRSNLKLDVNFVIFFVCVSFITHGMFLLLLPFSKFLAFESHQELSTALLWFPFFSVVVSLLVRHHEMQNAVLPPACWPGSSLLCQLRWFVNCGNGVI